MKRILIFAILLMLFATSVSAAGDESSLFEEQFIASGADRLYDALPAETKDTLSGLGIDTDHPGSVGAISGENAFKLLIDSVRDGMTAPLTSGILALSFLLVCSVFIALRPSSSLSGITEYICALFLAVSVVTPLVASILRIAEIIENCGNFMTAFVPVYSGILLCSGRPASAASYQTLVFGAAQVITIIGRSFVVPLCGMFLALCIASGIAPTAGISGILSAVKRVGIFALSFSMTLFTAILSITGGINSAADSVSQRTAKFFVGSFVPVVGGVLSEALGSVQGCLMLLRGSVGILGAAAVFVFVLPGIVELVLWRFMLSLAASAAEILGFTSSVGFFNSVASAVSVMLSVIICVAALLIVSFAMLFLAGGGV